MHLTRLTFDKVATASSDTGGFSLARTSKSLMFFGRLKATIGGSGMAFCMQSVGGVKDWEVFSNPSQISESRCHSTFPLCDIFSSGASGLRIRPPPPRTCCNRTETPSLA